MNGETATLSGLAILVLGVLAAVLRWIRTRLDGGEIRLVSRSAEKLTARAEEAEAALVLERQARIAAQECAKCAAEARDLSQERLIVKQESWMVEQRGLLLDAAGRLHRIEKEVRNGDTPSLDSPIATVDSD